MLLVCTGVNILPLLWPGNAALSVSLAHESCPLLHPLHHFAATCLENAGWKWTKAGRPLKWVCPWEHKLRTHSRLSCCSVMSPNLRLAPSPVHFTPLLVSSCCSEETLKTNKQSLPALRLQRGRARRITIDRVHQNTSVYSLCYVHNLELKTYRTVTPKPRYYKYHFEQNLYLANLYLAHVQMQGVQVKSSQKKKYTDIFILSYFPTLVFNTSRWTALHNHYGAINWFYYQFRIVFKPDHMTHGSQCAFIALVILLCANFDTGVASSCTLQLPQCRRACVFYSGEPLNMIIAISLFDLK